MSIPIQDYAGAKILQIITDVIPAGKSKRINAVGKIIALDNSTDQLSIQTENGTKHLLNAGAVEYADDSALYESITLYNDTAGDVTYTLYYGFGDYIGTRQLITGSIAVISSVLPTGAATAAKQDAEAVLVGPVTETAPATDTASSGLNGRLQRIAQRLTSLLSLLPAALGQTTKAASLSVSVASDDDLQGKIGSLTETAPASDTASSGLNGRLQRVAQRLTSLIALIPVALGQSTMANSFRVVIASDQSAVSVTNTPVTPTTSFVNSAASTNATSTKASAGTVWSIYANNLNAAVRFLKLYNKASAPTVGTDIPVMTIPIPATGMVQISLGANGLRFATGIAWALTALGTDADTTVVAAAEHKVAISYT